MADSDSRAGVRYANAAIVEWTAGIHASHDAALATAFDSPAAHGMPNIMISPSEGKFLGMLLQLIGATKVVEIGTLAGYSTIWMARALGSGGALWTIEYDEKHAEVAKQNVVAAQLEARVEVVCGAAVDVLPSLVPHGPFDAVFLDADKANYANYGQWAASNVRSGGLLMADNAYLFGNLLGDGPAAAEMRRFHEMTRDQFESVCVPTPDGLVVARRR